MRRYLNTLIFLYAACFSTEAQNRPDKADAASPAFAYQLKGVVVDGDTSDWDKTAARYPMRFFSGSVAEENRTAFFRSGYNQEEGRIYFVVVVKNNAPVFSGSTDAGAKMRDIYTLFLDRDNLARGSGVIGYSFNEEGKELSKTEESWDPVVRQAGWDGVQTACRTYGSTAVYECSLALKDQVKPGKVFGTDHLVSFNYKAGDPVRKSFLSWGNTTVKDQLPGKLGYLILLKPVTRTGLVSGTLHWNDTHIKGFPESIRILSRGDTAFNVCVPVDTGGCFSAVLPEGSYTITPARSFFRFDNELYKIDLQASAKRVTVSSAKSNPGVQVLLTTLKMPDLIPDKGLLYDFDQNKARRLDEIIRAYQDYYLIPGVSLALISNGKVIYHRTYGVKNAYTSEPVTDSTLFEAASVTKTVFAFAVNSLAEKGIIDLDRPLYSYLPFEEISYDDRYKLITARHVLCHRTGLPNWAYNEPDGKLRLKFTPGTGYGYSGEGFEYLKRVIEKITGRDIESVVNEEVIKPLGLEHIYFTGNPYLEKTGATGHYENLPTRTDLPDKPGMAWSMYTEALGFTRFMLALQNRGILKPETYNEMFRFQSTVDLDEKEIREGRDIHYGLGIYLENTPFGLMYGHGGNNGDFQCQYLMFRDLNMGFAIFTNSSTGGLLVHQDMRKILITGNGRRSTSDGR